MPRIARLLVLVGVAAAIGVFTPNPATAREKKSCKVKCDEMVKACNKVCSNELPTTNGIKPPPWTPRARAKCHSNCNGMRSECEKRCKARKKR